MARPSFKAAWSAAQKIYDPTNPTAKVAKVIGGNVALNINIADPKIRWENTCAVRISYILNQCGLKIPKIAGQTVSGEDKIQYFHYVKDVIKFLTQRWGDPIIVKYPSSGGGVLAGKQGLILFQVSGWSNAMGHATLFNGSICYDHCYFNELESNYKTDKASFWSLP